MTEPTCIPEKDFKCLYHKDGVCKYLTVKSGEYYCDKSQRRVYVVGDMNVIDCEHHTERFNQ